jgi:hypothetical protein
MAPVATAAAIPVAAAVVRAAGALELLAVRTPETAGAAVSVEARAPAKVAVVSVEAASAAEAATPAAKPPEERRLQHLHLPQQIRRAQQPRGRHKRLLFQHV